MVDDQDADYGDRAVIEPATKALAYGEKAITAGRTSAKRKAKKKPSASSQTIATNLTVNSDSQLDAYEFASHLKQSGLPKKLAQSIAVKDGRIILPSSVPNGVPKSQWLSDLLAIREDWELTTGELQLVLKKDWKSWWGQRVLPDLDGEASYGPLMTKRSNNDRETVLNDTNRCWVVPGAPVYGINTGFTVPTYDMQKKQIDAGEKPQLAVLDSRRGLIIIANRAQLYFLEKERSCWTIEQLKMALERSKYQPKIGRWILRNSILHELAAHAGLLTQGLPAEHTPGNPNSRVEENVAAVNALNKKPETELQNFKKAMDKEITHMRAAQVVP